MRFVQYNLGGSRRLGIVVGEEVADVAGLTESVALRDRGFRGRRAKALAGLLAPTEVADFLALGVPARQLAAQIAGAVGGASAEQRDAWRAQQLLLSLGSLAYEAPFSPDSAFWCIGLNYRDHVAEQAGRTPSEHPGIFLRVPNTFVGHRAPLLRPTGVSVDLDFEGELAVVIGKPGHRIPKAEALEYVAGYTVFNDGSVRDFQKRGPELTPGKNFYHSGSLGPWIVTADEVPDPQDIDFTTTLAGEVMQSASTRDMIFDVATVIAAISEYEHMQPGDVIATGTASGIGFRRNPPRFMKPGEDLRIEFRGVGVLENTVIEESEEFPAK